MLGLQRLTNGLCAQLRRRATYGTIVHAASAVKPAGGNEVEKPTAESSTTRPTSSNLVAAAFESLKSDAEVSNTEGSVAKPAPVNIDERIIHAKTVNGLLSIVENNVPVSRKHALKIVSILADWSNMNRVKLSEFENDSRFLRLCRLLGRTANKNGQTAGARSGNNNGNEQTTANGKPVAGYRTDDLNTVLGVAGDDEAAKLIASISVPQMVKVMTALALRKRRSTPLLRSLAFNISSATEILDLKQCADVLYAMACLSFQDSVLSAKICADVHVGLSKNKDKSAVVGSILTSLGILKYRDLDILEALTQWILEHSDICRPQDLGALFLTSSTLNFKSQNLSDVRDKLTKSLVKEDFPRRADWLNHVWALTLLGIVDNAQLSLILSADFIAQLESEKALTPTYKMKLLNLNSFAKLLAKDYAGPLLAADSTVFDVPLTHSKSKLVLVNGMLDTLKNLISNSSHVQSQLDSKMGFLIDACCMFDAKRNPLPLNKAHANATKVALMVVDYHDICHGNHRAITGLTNLSFDLLEKSGYQVLPVPYNEFNTSDKLLKRVQYLEAKLKTINLSK